MKHAKKEPEKRHIYSSISIMVTVFLLKNYRMMIFCLEFPVCGIIQVSFFQKMM